MTAIEWTDETWNPTTGCDRVSPGCDNCYALTLAKRLKAMGQPKYQNDGDTLTSGPGFALTCHPGELQRPLRWWKPRLVFVNSMSDLFHPDVPYRFIRDVFNTMRICNGMTTAAGTKMPSHTFQVLTKRPQRMAELANDAALGFNPAAPPPNVWLGTSIESDRYTFRADHLRATPSAVRFLSLEPLLGPLPSLDLTGIDWVIAGGESGPGARPMHPDWVRDIRDRCVAAGIPFFFKQWGAFAPGEPVDEVSGGSTYVNLDGSSGWVGGDDDYITNWTGEPIGGWFWMARVGKKRAGRVLDGRTWDEMPAVAAEDITRTTVTVSVSGGG